MKLSDIQHLDFIYERMKNVHKEKKNIDYMLKFKGIIDSLPNSLINISFIGELNLFADIDIFVYELDLELFDNIEIHPVKEIDNAGTCEVCEAEDADFWSAYIHLNEGGLQCIADLPTKAQAEDFMNIINKLINA